jgi:hypothetical protein
MKIDKKTLKRIIEEEIQHLEEINPSHLPAGSRKGGQFTKRGAGNIYSLTDKAKDNLGPDSKLKAPARGRETASGGVGSVKYGANTGAPNKQCGGRTMSGGEKKNPTRSCSNYPDLYELLLDGLNEGSQEDICNKCIQGFLARLNRANRAVKNAQAGKDKSTNV